MKNFSAYLFKHGNHILVFILMLAIGAGILSYFFLFQNITYQSDISKVAASGIEKETKNNQGIIEIDEGKNLDTIHVTTPTDGVRGVYMSSWIAGHKTLRIPIVELVDTTGLNALVIDLKDVTGRVNYDSQHPGVLGFTENVVENRIQDFPELIQELHEKDIYVIGRIAVFQDDFSPRHHFASAVQKKDGTLWSDRRGLEWFDVGSREVWDYIVAISEDAYALGVDEINLDYVRFPSDGNTQDMVLPQTQSSSHPDALQDFFAYIDQELRVKRGIPVSADVFGIITTTNHDVGIGQIFENIAPYVDAIAPMIYPSHYPNGFQGYPNPADVPYEIITFATEGAIGKLESLGMDPTKHLRPWIQDFNLGATYDAQKVTAQIQALYDLGITSFLVWDPANTYTSASYRNFDFSQSVSRESMIQ